MPVEQYTTLVGKHERGPAALSVPDDAAIENLGAADRPSGDIAGSFQDVVDGYVHVSASSLLPALNPTR
jgi:hypothetical protein